MNTVECYRKFGGNYEDVLTRFGSAELVTRFALQFLNDTSYEDLMKALEEGNAESAFRAAHTLKGLCSNLGFTALWKASDSLCEQLRAGETICMEDIDAVRVAYYTLTDALVQLRNDQ